jgi:hypothetical protein
MIGPDNGIYCCYFVLQIYIFLRECDMKRCFLVCEVMIHI